jgi:hypothetical protein
MKFTVNDSQGIYLYSNLVNADKVRLFHEAHSEILAHPADILRDKTASIFKSIRLLTEHLADRKAGDDTLKDLTKDLALRLDSFYDSLFLIIKCFSKPGGTPNKDVTRWLKERRESYYVSFIGATNEPHKKHRDIANKIKHDHTEISIIDLVNHKNKPVLGFFIQAIVGENDRRGPDPTIHRMHRGIVNTAFSYNHYLLGVGGHILHLLHHLNKSIFEKRPEKHEPFPELLGIMHLLSKMEHEFFPDEFLTPYADIKARDGVIQIEYPQKYKKRAGENFDAIFSTNASLDINSRTNQSNRVIPYLQLIYPETLVRAAKPN